MPAGEDQARLSTPSATGKSCRVRCQNEPATMTDDRHARLAALVAERPGDFSRSYRPASSSVGGPPPADYNPQTARGRTGNLGTQVRVAVDAMGGGPWRQRQPGANRNARQQRAAIDRSLTALCWLAWVLLAIGCGRIGWYIVSQWM